MPTWADNWIVKRSKKVDIMIGFMAAKILEGGLQLECS
jgi:hypothetical protein